MERTCGKCCKGIRDIEPAQCAFCEMFFHTQQECSDVSRSNMQQFFSCGKALWLCPDCRVILANRTLRKFLLDVRHNHSKDIQSLTEQVQDLSDDVRALKRELANYHTAVTTNNEKLNAPFSRKDQVRRADGDTPGASKRLWPTLSVKRRRGDDGEVVASKNDYPASCRGTREMDFSDLSIPCIVPKAAQPKFWLHLAGLEPKITDEDVSKIICRCMEIKTEECPDFVRLIPKDKDTSSYTYVSFKVGLDPQLKEKALLLSTWPRNVKIREFIKRNPKNSVSQRSSFETCDPQNAEKPEEETAATSGEVAGAEARMDQQSPVPESASCPARDAQ